MATQAKKKTKLDSLYTYLQKGNSTPKQRTAYTEELITRIGYVITDFWCDLENKVKQIDSQWTGKAAEAALKEALALAEAKKKWITLPFLQDLQMAGIMLYKQWKPLKLNGVSGDDEKQLRVATSRLMQWHTFLCDMPASVGRQYFSERDIVETYEKSRIRQIIEAELGPYIDILQPYPRLHAYIQEEIKRWEVGKGKLRKKEGIERPPISPDLAYILQNPDLLAFQEIRKTDWKNNDDTTPRGKIIPGLKANTDNFVVETKGLVIGDSGKRLFAFLLGKLTEKAERFVMIETREWMEKTDCKSWDAASRQIRRGYDELRNIKNLSGMFIDLSTGSARRAKREMLIVGTIDTIEEYGYRIFIDNAFLDWVRNFPPMPYALEDHLRHPALSSFLFYLYYQKAIKEGKAKEPVHKIVLSIPTLIAHCPTIPRESEWTATVKKNFKRNVTDRLFHALDAFSNRFSYELCDARRKPLTDGNGNKIETPEDVEKIKRNYGVLQGKYVIITFIGVYSSIA